MLEVSGEDSTTWGNVFSFSSIFGSSASICSTSSFAVVSKRGEAVFWSDCGVVLRLSSDAGIM